MVRLCVREVVSLTLVSYIHSSYIGMNVCGSAYENGCMVDGKCATGVLYTGHVNIINLSGSVSTPSSSPSSLDHMIIT